MKSKKNYSEEFKHLVESAENELKEVLDKLPHKRYQYISDEEMEKIADNPKTFISIDAPIVTVVNGFDNRHLSIYVESIYALENGAVLISGFEDPSFAELESRNYRLRDIVNCDFNEIFKYLNVWC